MEGRTKGVDMSFSLLRWKVQQLKSIIHNLPEAVLKWEVIVHQVDQIIIVVDVLDDHARGRLLFVELGPLLNPQSKGLILPRRERCLRGFMHTLYYLNWDNQYHTLLACLWIVSHSKCCKS